MEDKKNKKYYVTCRTIHYEVYEVEASSMEEAESFTLNGQGEYVGGSFSQIDSVVNVEEQDN